MVDSPLEQGQGGVLPVPEVLRHPGAQGREQAAHCGATRASSTSHRHSMAEAAQHCLGTSITASGVQLRALSLCSAHQQPDQFPSAQKKEVGTASLLRLYQVRKNQAYDTYFIKNFRLLALFKFLCEGFL